MNKIEYSNRVGLEKLSVMEKAKHIAFFLYKTSNTSSFTMKTLSESMVEFGQNKPNSTRLKRDLLATRFFAEDKGQAGSIRFTDIGIETLENEQAGWWTDYTSIASDSELLDEVKFCGKRGYLDALIRQINHSYAGNCYDAAAVLMRRLFEVLLILAYQANEIDDEIKTADGKGYRMLEGIVSNAKENKTLSFSRVRNYFDDIRNIGNFSAHSITYTAGRKDIDDIRLNYRVAIEELFNKAKLM